VTSWPRFTNHHHDVVDAVVGDHPDLISLIVVRW